MKTSFAAFFAISGFFAGAFASPVAAPAPVAVEKRDNNAAVFTILQDLYTTVQTYTGSINSTLAAIPTDASAEDKSAASSSINQNIASITDEINKSTTVVSALPAIPARALAKRRASTGDIAGLFTNLFLEISGTLNGIIASLGLGSLLGFLTPLTTSLAGLILALKNVADQLLAVVKQLLDGLLGGLAAGLAGLIL